MTRTIPRATVADSLRFAVWHTVPGLLRGTYAANPRLTRLLAALGTERRAAAQVDRMRVRYGGRSVWLARPGGRTLLVLSRTDMRRVLDVSGRMFSPATAARRRGLGVVEPHALPATARVADRADRLRFHEAVLDTASLDHAHIRSVVAAEVGALLATTSTFTWSAADTAVGRVARRLVLGDDARDDTIVTRLNRALRHDANWCGRRPFRRRLDAALRRALRRRVDLYLAGARPGSLAARARHAPVTGRTDPGGQVPSWLAAFDLLPSLVTYALALLAGAPAETARAEEEAAAGPGPKPYLTACLLEAARLRPPVPSVTRVTTMAVPWHGDRLPSGATVLVPLAELLRGPGPAYADGFAPRAWLDGAPTRHGRTAVWQAACPGAGPGLLVGAEMLAALLATARFELTAPRATYGEPVARDVRAIRMTIGSPAARTGVSGRAVPRQQAGREAARRGGADV